jgi:hypothetical protein
MAPVKSELVPIIIIKEILDQKRELERVRYPVADKFSFHWQRRDKMYRGYLVGEEGVTNLKSLI